MCKIRRYVMLIQPMMLLRFEDEYELPQGGRTSNISVLARSVLNPNVEKYICCTRMDTVGI